jgi:hypothetical protein
MTNFEQAKKICITLLSGETGSIGTELILSAVSKAVTLFALETTERELLVKQIEALYAIFSDQYRILDDAEPEPWVKNARAEIKWNFWNRYKMQLESKNFAPDTINKLDNLTDDILDRLVRPGTLPAFDKRGLIVGQVQSGKTSNYTGLICKAADAGYKLIIVLAGLHNSLRTQTQLRIDEGFLGFDTQTARNFSRTSNRIGVGKFNPNLAAHSLTTSEPNGDFNRAASESSGINIRGNDPIILVIKKNASVMKNLLGWLASRGETMTDGRKLIKSLPLLVIDDEADNASINVSKSQVSTINGAIRALLSLFEQRAYIGYTATPYANIFVRYFEKEEIENLSVKLHKDIELTTGQDIFPKDFIVNIPAPSNYIGPAKVFGIVSSSEIDKKVKPIHLYRIIDDYQPAKPDPRDKDAEKEYNELIEDIRKDNIRFITDQHKKDDEIPRQLPESLKYAIKCFFLSCAARRVRGQATEHNSMLIHVSRFVRWQDNVAGMVLKVVKSWSNQIEFNQGTIVTELKTIWETDYIPTSKKIAENPSVDDPDLTPVSWEEILVQLYPAVAKIDVRAVHGDSRVEGLTHKNIKPLDYYEHSASGLSVIAIGGNKLSRGLTLEGLTVSYYLRASKMYDTLMQMGRWFGYRPGYLDFCRLFISEELVEWYRHIVVATEEMRAEFDRMDDLGKKPSDYGLKVRTHPGVLAITASNKFRYKKIMMLSYSGELEETYSFRKNSPRLRSNYDSTLKFIRELGEPDKPRNTKASFRKHFVWHKNNNSWQIVDFLSGYFSDQASFNTRLMADYILAQAGYGWLKNWTVAVINNSRAAGENRISAGADLDIGLTLRSDDNDGEKYSETYNVAKSHIIDPSHEYIDLTDEQIKKAKDQTLDDFIRNKKERTEVINPNTLRIKTNRPPEDALLLIYLLNPKPDPEGIAVSDCPIVGLALSFPWLENDKKIEYAVNQQFIQQLNYPEEMDELDTGDEWSEEKSEEQEQSVSNILLEMETGPNFDIKDKIEFLYGIPENEVLSKLDDLSPDIKNLKLSGSVAEKINQSKLYDAMPFYSAMDITRYGTFTNKRSWIVNSKKTYFKTGEVIIGSLIAGQERFTIPDTDFMIDDTCVGIQPGVIDPLYLLAILNSVLYIFYSRELNSGVTITTSLILQFPVRDPGKKVQGIRKLVQSLLLLNKQEQATETRIMTNFLSGVADLAVFEIYFPEDFRKNSLSVLSELEKIDLPPAPTLSDLKKIYNLLSLQSGNIKRALYEVGSIEKFNLIYKSLKG